MNRGITTTKHVLTSSLGIILAAQVFSSLCFSDANPNSSHPQSQKAESTETPEETFRHSEDKTCSQED
jgi:hypothetical protein